MKRGNDESRRFGRGGYRRTERDSGDQPQWRRSRGKPPSLPEGPALPFRDKHIVAILKEYHYSDSRRRPISDIEDESDDRSMDAQRRTNQQQKRTKSDPSDPISFGTLIGEDDSHRSALPPLDHFIHRYFARNRSIGSNDRKYIGETVYNVMRYRGLLSELWTNDPKKRNARLLLSRLESQIAALYNEHYRPLANETLAILTRSRSKASSNSHSEDSEHRLEAIVAERLQMNADGFAKKYDSVRAFFRELQLSPSAVAASAATSASVLGHHASQLDADQEQEAMWLGIVKLYERLLALSVDWFHLSTAFRRLSDQYRSARDLFPNQKRSRQSAAGDSTAAEAAGDVSGMIAWLERHGEETANHFTAFAQRITAEGDSFLYRRDSAVAESFDDPLLDNEDAVGILSNRQMRRNAITAAKSLEKQRSQLPPSTSLLDALLLAERPENPLGKSLDGPAKLWAGLRIPRHLLLNCPLAFYDLLVRDYGEAAAERIARANNYKAPLFVRANALKTTRDSLLDIFRNKYQFAVRPCDRAPMGIVFDVRVMTLTSLDEYKNGLFEIQDEGSQLVADMVQPNAQFRENVLDVCAGAGGKSLAIGAQMGSGDRLYISDIRRAALSQAKLRFRRAGLQSVHVLPLTAPAEASEAAVGDETGARRFLESMAGKFDWVVADVPCSGSGTFRRNPDSKWKMTPASIRNLRQLQREIIASAVRYMKPGKMVGDRYVGGRLVYATCSLLRCENEDQIQHFLETHNLEIDVDESSGQQKMFKSLPSIPASVEDISEASSGMDGFFAVVLRHKLQ